MKPLFKTLASTAALTLFAAASFAQGTFTLTSPALVDGGTMPADLKCIRDGGDGMSPPLAWGDVPAGTNSFVVIMSHYPRGAVEGRDAPSQYWLLWGIPSGTTTIERGNPQSIGNEGANKDERETGYTSPCSPGAGTHDYTITLFALSYALDTLPDNDALSVDWTTLTTAMDGKTISSVQLSFEN